MLMSYEFRPVMMRLRVDLPSEPVARRVFAKLDDDDFFYKINLRYASIVDYDRKGVALFFDCKPKKGAVEAAQKEIGELLDALIESVKGELSSESQPENRPDEAMTAAPITEAVLP